MDIRGPARRLSAYVGENVDYEGRPLYQALVEAARAQGCAGATVVRGIEGFGATSRTFGKHALRMSEDAPVVVVVIDVEHRIAALAAVFSAMVEDGLVTVEDIEVVAYRGGSSQRSPE